MLDVGEFSAAMRTSDRPRDRVVAELAARQHGVVAHRQLRELGLAAGTITRAGTARRLHRLHEGVYVVGHRCLPRHAREMAAVLACGTTALLSHRSAAGLMGLIRMSAYPVDVTTARRCRQRAGIAIHRSRSIHDEDRDVLRGIPVTSVARTLLDLAEVAPPRVLAHAIEQAERLELFDLRAVERLIGRSRGRHGLRALDAALRDHRPPPFTRSGLERRFIDLCDRAGLPRPAANLWIGEHEVDMSWPGHRLVVELDAHETHGTRAAFERDRRRDATLQIMGYRVLRITDRRLRDAPADVVRTVRALLDRV